MITITVLQGDITLCETEAIVNAANEQLRPGAGVDAAIHRAAGFRLAEECKRIGRCATGKIVVTHGYLLRALYVIHAVTPVVEEEGSRELLKACYVNALRAASERGLESVAFPALGAGIGGGFSRKEAAKIAFEAIRSLDPLEVSPLKKILLVSKTKRMLEAFTEAQ